MKITGYFAVMLIGITCLFPLSGCHLIDFPDFIHHPDKYAKLCPVKRITYYTDSNSDTIVVDFRYNKWGNPVHARFSYTSTGRPAFAFIYDKKQRLTDYIAIYGDVGGYDGSPEKLNGSGYEFWHHYVYENNRVVRDTLRGMDDYPEPIANYMWLITYQYDAYDRVIQTFMKPLRGLSYYEWKEIYTYDARGNMSRRQVYLDNFPHSDETFGNYTDKPNIRTTNKVWMFVDNNYSVNAPYVAARYNRYGLPLKMQLPPEQSLGFLYQWNIGESDIVYDCR
jgi:hypothetical protein